MSDEYRFTILVEKNGIALDNMPIIQRYSVAEDATAEVVQAADNNTTSFHAIPQLTMGTLGFFLLTTDQALNVKFNLNTPVPFNANGLILFLGCALAQATPNQNIEVNNPAVSTAANLDIVGGGT